MYFDFTLYRFENKNNIFHSIKIEMVKLDYPLLMRITNKMARMSTIVKPKTAKTNDLKYNLILEKAMVKSVVFFSAIAVLMRLEKLYTYRAGKKLTIAMMM